MTINSQAYKIPCGNHSFEFTLSAEVARMMTTRPVSKLAGVICPTCGREHALNAAALIRLRLDLEAELLPGAEAEALETALAEVDGDPARVNSRAVRETALRRVNQLAEARAPLVLSAEDAPEHRSKAVLPEERNPPRRSVPPPLPPDQTGILQTPRRDK
jgi:hypothetical protein